MKTKIVIALGAFFVLNSCNLFMGKIVFGSGKVIKERRELTKFTTIDNCTVFDIIVRQGSSSSAIVEVDDNVMQYVDIAVEGDRLEIRTKDARLEKLTKKTIYITAESLIAFQNNGTGDVAIGELNTIGDFYFQNNGTGDVAMSFSARKIEIDDSGTGDLSYSGACKELELDNSSTGDVTIKSIILEKLIVENSATGNLKLFGKTADFRLKQNGTGNVEAFDMTADIVDVDNSGTGEIKVCSAKELSINSSGTGDVKYKGNGILKKMTNDGTGEVQKVN